MGEEQQGFQKAFQSSNKPLAQFNVETFPWELSKLDFTLSVTNRQLAFVTQFLQI